VEKTKCLHLVNKSMIKCKCYKCGKEEVFEDHKQAWMAGWDFLSDGKMICGDCSSMSFFKDNLLSKTANKKYENPEE